MDKDHEEGLSTGVRAVNRPLADALDAGGLSPSPVTCLARNLGGLLTSGGSGTPRRRISWSSNADTPKELGKLRKSRLFLGGNMADSPQIPYQQDSHMFQDESVAGNCLDIIGSRLVRRGRTLPHTSRETCGKDNMSRCQQVQEEDGTLRTSLPLKSISVCLNTAGSSFGCSSCERASVSASGAESDGEKDGFLSVLDMDALDSDDSSSVNDFRRLLRDPLLSGYEDSDQIGAESPGKLQVRRCLSMIGESPVARPFLAPRQELLECVDRIRRPENTRKRLLQDGEDNTFKKVCAQENGDKQTQERKSLSDSLVLASPRNIVQRSHSEADTITRALQISTDSSDLIADCSRSYALPLVKGKHDDLKAISCTTLSDLMNGRYEDSVGQYQIVDCRYPYEFDGGHIKGACNLYTRESILENLIDKQAQPSSCKKRSILVFHCEFSSERGPKLSRFLRSKDREANQDNYPSLFHPEVYLLEGGYKDFFKHHKELCVPQDYLPMLSKDHKSDLIKFRSKSKSWSRVKSRVVVRPGLKL